MNESGNTEKKWQLPSINLKLPSFKSKTDNSGEQLPDENQSRSTLYKIREVVRILCLALYRLRSVFLSIPVIFAALRLAAYNSEHLPLLVGLDLQSTGEFARTISRQSAVTFPLMITAGCLALMFLSKKTLYPWLISIFSLAIPVLLLITNMYPA